MTNLSISIHDEEWPFVSVCFGGGVDSSAMLGGMRMMGWYPRLITFANTGGEKPETYEYVRRFDKWLTASGFPLVMWCEKITLPSTVYDDLEGNCVDNETLPSLAFGMKSCSAKWKIDPQDYGIMGCKSWHNKIEPHPMWLEAKKRGIKPIKLIGYDNGTADIRRSKNLAREDDNFRFVYPLQEWGWDRKDCVKFLAEHDMEIPLKSACWYCPASKQWEIYWLAAEHPDLFMRALEMEYIALTGHHSRFDKLEFGDDWESLVQNAERFPSSNTTVGLGRSFAWNHFARIHGIVSYETNGKMDLSLPPRRRVPGDYLTMTFIGDRKKLMAKAMELQAEKSDNALDGRTC